MKPIPIFPKGDRWCFRVRLQPGSSRDQVAGIQEDALKVQVSAPPLEGRANKQLIKFLAREMGIARSRLEIASGHRSRDKTIAVEGVSERQLFASLVQLLKSS